MGNSQPNISRSVATLESQLGSRLFNRSSTGVTLTEAGSELFSHVEPAYRHLRAAEENIRSAREMKRGTFSIRISTGLTRGVIQKMLLPTIDEFHDKYPDVRLEISHGSSSSIKNDVQNELIDIGFITLNQNEYSRKNKDLKILYSYNDIAIAGPRYSSLSEKKISLSELGSYPLIGLDEKTDTFQYYRDHFSRYGIEYRPSIITMTTGQLLNYALGNYGIGFIHPDDAKEELENNQLIKIELKEKLPKRKMAMIKNSKNKHPAEIFEKMLIGNLNS